MKRSDILRDLVDRGTDTTPPRCAEIAADLDLLTSDALTIAGHPVPAELLPPQRDARVMKKFAYRVSHCNHAQMAALTDFIRTLPIAASPIAPADPSTPTGPDRKVYAAPDAGHFAVILDGLLRNRGFGPKELPFTGLSLSTIYGSMLTHDRRDEHRRYQLGNVAGPLGWRFEDLAAIAHEPPSERPRYAIHCHHLGQVYIAAIHHTTEQLIEIAKHADRLTERSNQGAWQPVSDGFAKECPDLTGLT
jgi:hypothetical protein